MFSAQRGPCYGGGMSNTPSNHGLQPAGEEDQLDRIIISLEALIGAAVTIVNEKDEWEELRAKTKRRVDSSNKRRAAAAGGAP